MKIYLKDHEATELLGRLLGESLKGGELICLVGDLGAGKTTLTQSIAKALEIEDDITSPTFTIINEYESDGDEHLGLNHFDVYRIGAPEEMFDIGFDEYIDSGRVNVIEWADIIEDILPQDRLDIEMKYHDTARLAELKPYGDYYGELVKEILKALEENGVRGE